MATKTFGLDGGHATVTVEGVPTSQVRITINGQEVELGTDTGPVAGTAAEGVSKVRLTATGGVPASGSRASVRVSSTSRVERRRRDDPHAPPGSSANRNRKP
jgi:hypothetical protein